MKKSVLIVLLAVAFSSLKAQTDFAIPDAPAFTAVQQQPTAILRASSSKEFMVNIGTAILSETVNQSPWGVEYSFYKRLKIPVALSYATNLSPVRSVALGIRWDILNEINAQKNTTFDSLINNLTASSNEIIAEAEKSVASKHNIDISTVRTNPAYQTEIAKTANDLVGPNKDFNLLREMVKDTVEKLLWNKNVLTLAVAAGFTSSDGSYDMLSVGNRRIQAWGVYTYQLGDMLQINANISFLQQHRNGYDTTSSGFAVRGHYGINELKGTLDFSLLAAKEYKPNWQFSFGAEYNFIDNYWLLGRIVYDTKSDKVIPTIDIKVGM